MVKLFLWKIIKLTLFVHSLTQCKELNLNLIKFNPFLQLILIININQEIKKNKRKYLTLKIERGVYYKRFS